MATDTGFVQGDQEGYAPNIPKVALCSTCRDMSRSMGVAKGGVLGPSTQSNPTEKNY